MLNKKLLWLLSLLFIVLVGMRFNISILAWVMFVPLLLLVRESEGKKAWFSLFVLIQIAYFLQIAKIITDPMPIVMALMFSAPMAISSLVLLWIFEKARRRVGDMLGIFFFASLMSVSEWLTFFTSELGSWGSMTYTQLDDLAFLQLSSLFGITFSSFFIYLSSAFIAVFIVNQKRKKFIKPALITSVIFVLFYSYGVWRVESGIQGGKHVLVAGIASDMQITPKGIPDKKYLEKGTNTLIERTETAIKRGAKLIAWNEGATIIFKEDEFKFIQQLTRVSLESSVDLVIAYIVPIDGIKKFENKYLLISKGKIIDEYFKYHPVPGEGSIKGTKFAKVADLGYAKVSGAICYDFDFPTLARVLSQNGADIVIVPSSDWRGIDPIHGFQAMVRAIEGGYSLLRPVRGATSFAFDAFGNIRSSMSYFEENDRILMASLPTKQIWTLYKVVGDIFPLLLLVFLGFVGIVYKRDGERKNENEKHRKIK
jgi:apolipoprotein N-acyltransferase